MVTDNKLAMASSSTSSIPSRARLWPDSLGLSATKQPARGHVNGSAGSLFVKRLRGLKPADEPD